MKSILLPAALCAAVCLSARAATYVVGDRIDLALPDGQPSFSLSIVAAPPAGIAGQSYIARDMNGEASAIVKPTADGLRVTIDDFENRKIYSVIVRNDVVESTARDVSKGDCEDVGDVCGTCTTASMPPPDGTASTRPPKFGARRLASSRESFPIAERKAVVDILVAFDRGAKAWVESGNRISGDTITNFADYAVNKMNYVLEKSQLLDKFSYRLVGVVEVDGQWATIAESGLLEKLRTRAGALSKVGELREKCGADTITLLIDRDRTQSGTSGQGFEYASSYSAETFDNSNYACNVCDVKTVYERYTMSHETGHNMGCGHSNRYASTPGRYSYSYGYNFTDANSTNRYTIMAYDRTSPASGAYLPIPYFSTPCISPPEYGCALGEAGTNDNRQTLLNTYADIAGLREHVVPYEWDVRFLDDSGNDIPDGTYFVDTLYITLTNSNPDATIYFTYDGSTPGPGSYSCRNGQRFPLYESRTITACAVTNGVAMSVRTVKFNAGQFWSGEASRNGSGAWIDDDAVLAWDSPAHAYDVWTPVVFSDLPEIASATVSVRGAVAPIGASFVATATAYTFEKGTADASLRLGDASFAPSGDLTFNLPVKLDAVAFTNPANHTIAFNAPFGQSVTETTGCCTNAIGIGSAGTLVVSPGVGKTQTFDHFSNVNWFYNNATIRVGEGTVVFRGPVGAKGLFGSTQMNIAREGRVVIDVPSASSDPFYTSKVSGEGTVEYRAKLPSDASRWASSSWKGTVAFDGLAADASTQNFQFESYGNANSKVLLRNCAISYLNSNNATFPGTLVLERDADGHAAFTTVNGSSGKYNVFGALEGDGAMSFATGQRQGYVFNHATNYTGGISVGAQNNYGVVGGRYIVFGQVASAGDLPSQSATITVKPGATASIGGGATWNAYHGVEIGGTLLVKGADATLDCNASAATGLKLDDGATLRFEAEGASLVFAKEPRFASGTVNIDFANGVAPANDMVLVRWPNGSSVPDGDFVFSDATVAAKWTLRKASTGLVVENAPLPEQVPVSITVRHWGDDGWEDVTLRYDLPTQWATNHYPALTTVEEVSAKYNETASNGAAVWQCYMLGLDPTDAMSNVSLSMTVADNKIRFAIEGLGETHALDGIQVYWYMKTSTDLATDSGFTKTRDSSTGLSPVFAEHPMPDKATAIESQTADRLFYKINASFVAE